MPGTDGKMMIVLTLLPGGKRLATLRRVERFEGGQVVFQADRSADRTDTLPAGECIPVKGAEGIAPAGLGLGLRRLQIGDLGPAGDLGACEVFDVPPDAAFYLVRGPGEEARGDLLDALKSAVTAPGARFAAAPTGYDVAALPEAQMRKLGWVRIEETEEADTAPQNNTED